MISLSQEQKDAILNFYFRCGTEEEINYGRDLIAGDPRAAELYASLEETLQRLDHVKYEPCPDNLAELTIAKLKLAHAERTGQSNLQKLLSKEQLKSASRAEKKAATRDRSFWRPVAEAAAIAAVILIAAGILFPTTKYMRHKAWQAACSARLAEIFAGIQRYQSDNDGMLPAVALSAGSPWWKIGRSGDKAESNTRHLWLLVQNDYVKPKAFTCPGRKTANPLDLSFDQIRKMHDFPERENLNFSFTFLCGDKQKKVSDSMAVLLADLNPVFEKIFDRLGNTDTVKIKIDEKMLNALSRNHSGKGQNVLFYDGHVDFTKNRVLFGDDIFTIKNQREYTGNEVPCEPGDIFLAP